MDRPAPRRLLRAALVVAALVAGGLPQSGAQAALTDPPVPPLSSLGSPPPCRISDLATKLRSTADWSRTMIDWNYRLPSSYRPPNLVLVARAGIAGSGSVRAELIPDLRALAAAARSAGAPVAVESAYRSYATQVSTFNSWVSRLGYARAILGSARPGHSEHQLGTALDFKSHGGRDPWAFAGYDWGATRTGRWLMQNAWKFGFVLSYPKGMKPQVCYGYEPWHYRYFGRTIARAMHFSGLTPRVWLWRHGSSPVEVQPNPTPTPNPSPSPEPTPSPTPTEQPTPTPTPTPTEQPTPTPTEPTPTPTPTPTEQPTPTPEAPTPPPTDEPTPTPPDGSISAPD
jgi:zinc D-Ala-D-Ala carboxypeptidase